MRYAIILLALALSACDEGAPRTQTKYGMDCTGYLNTNHSIYRCENEEAICYDHDEHLSCKFKQP